MFKRIFYIFLVIVLYSINIFAQSIKVMTFNIRYDNPKDGKNIWNNRKDELVKLLDYYEADFIGLQEVLINQLHFIKQNLTGYKYIGVGREDGNEKGEYAPIFYNSTKYDLLKSNTFWLSETPNKVSVGWDAALERICTYGIFKNKNSGIEYYVFNTHFDHIGNEARIKSAELILKIIDSITTNKSNIILIGDFNSNPEDEPIKRIKNKLQYAAEISEKSIYGPKGTFNGFDESNVVTELIDFIFVKNMKVKKYRHIDDKMPNNNFISDHYPVLMEAIIQDKN